MVHISEMRVVLPLTVDEFRRGQRFANFKTNELNTSEGQGGQLLSTLPYANETWGEGIYTHSLYRLGDRLPDWVTRLVPSNALIIDEKTWMAYPYVRTTISIPFFNKLKIEMLSMHANDDGSAENIFNLPEAELAIRKVDMIDIAFDDVPKGTTDQNWIQSFMFPRKQDEDLSERTGGVTRYLRCAHTNWSKWKPSSYWGVHNRAEKLMINGIRQIVLLTHRNAFCWLDEWFDLTYEEICARESLGRQRLKATVKQPPVIDPRTGQEVIIEREGPSSQDTDDSDEASDIEAEYFEAEMELGNQNAEQLGTRHIPGNETIITQPPDVPERCAVCATRDIPNSPPTIFCITCQEYFCESCLTEFHVTTRLKAHTTQRLLNSFTSSDSRRSVTEGKERLKKDPGLPPAHGVLRKSTTDMPQEKHSLNNGQETESKDGRLANIGSPPRDLGAHDQNWIVRTTSKLRSVKSGFGALNAAHRIDDMPLQDNPRSGASPIKVDPTDSDISALSDRPNELCEELVRCISSLHQRAAESIGALTRTNSQGLGSSKRVFGRRSSQDLSGADITMEVKGEPILLDPYDVKEEFAAWDIGLYADCLEVNVLPTESDIKVFTTLYRRFQGLLELLKHVEPKDLNHGQRLSFWINIYNTLMLHATLVYGVPKNHYKRVSLMNKVTYIVGGLQYNPLMIEHSILRSNSYRPVLASLLPIPRFKKGDEPAASSLDQAEPLVSFALCCGSKSSPSLRIYTAANIHTKLEQACQEYLMAAVGVSKRKRILIPKILHWYARDFSHDAESLIQWIATKLPQEKRAAFDECTKKRSGKGSRHRMSVQPYDWTFRYLYDPRLV